MATTLKVFLFVLAVVAAFTLPIAVATLLLRDLIG